MSASNLTTFASVAGVGTEVWGAGTLANAQVSDNAYASLSPVPTGTYETRYLRGLELVSKPADSGLLTEVAVSVEVKNTDPINSDMVFTHVHLVKGGVVLTSIDKAAATAVTGTDVVYTFTFTAANLAALGVTVADLSAVDFGSVCAFGCTETGLGVGLPSVDRMGLTYTQDPAIISGRVGRTSGQGFNRDAGTAQQPTAGTLDSKTAGRY